MKCPACDAENLPGEDLCASCGVSLTQQTEPRSDAHHSIVMDPISSLKPQPPKCLKASASALDAIRIMRDERCGSVFIIDDDGVLQGIFTERDALHRVAGQKDDLAALSLKEVMTPSPTALPDDASIAYALHLMSIHGFRHIPIIEEKGRPTGVMTYRRVVEYIGDLFG